MAEPRDSMAEPQDYERARQREALWNRTAMEKLIAISDRCAQRPALDPRSADEIYWLRRTRRADLT